MIPRFLFGPTTGDFADTYLGEVRGAGRCLAFGPGDVDLIVGPEARWDDVAAQFPAGWRPDLIALWLNYTGVPDCLWSAPVPIVGLATDWNLLWHEYRHGGVGGGVGVRPSFKLVRKNPVSVHFPLEKPGGRGETRCQFIFPWEAVPGDGGLARSSIARPSVRSIPGPRMVGRSGASRVRSSARLHFARRTPWLAIASDVPHRSFPVPPTRGKGSVRGRLVPNHGRGSSTIDTRRGR